MTTADLHVAPEEVLAGLPLLSFMPAEVRELVAACFMPQRFALGAVIVRQGDPADAYYVVVSGRVRVLAIGDDGDETALPAAGGPAGRRATRRAR